MDVRDGRTHHRVGCSCLLRLAPARDTRDQEALPWWALAVVSIAAFGGRRASLEGLKCRSRVRRVGSDRTRPAPAELACAQSRSERPFQGSDRASVAGTASCCQAPFVLLGLGVMNAALPPLVLTNDFKLLFASGLVAQVVGWLVFIGVRSLLSGTNADVQTWAPVFAWIIVGLSGVICVSAGIAVAIGEISTGRWLRPDRHHVSVRGDRRGGNVRALVPRGALRAAACADAARPTSLSGHLIPRRVGRLGSCAGRRRRLRGCSDAKGCSTLWWRHDRTAPPPLVLGGNTKRSPEGSRSRSARLRCGFRRRGTRRLLDGPCSRLRVSKRTDL